MASARRRADRWRPRDAAPIDGVRATPRRSMASARRRSIREPSGASTRRPRCDFERGSRTPTAASDPPTTHAARRAGAGQTMSGADATRVTRRRRTGRKSPCSLSIRFQILSDTARPLPLDRARLVRRLGERSRHQHSFRTRASGAVLGARRSKTGRRDIAANPPKGCPGIGRWRAKGGGSVLE